jgi:cobalt-zinc-cadmium efflux system membrane fusion protein
VAARGALALARGALVAAVVAGACSTGSTSERPPNGAHQPLARIEEIGDASAVTPPHPELFPLVAVELRQVPDRLTSTCVVGPDVDRTVPVNALGGGRVAELRARLGDHVEQGQPLVVISSPDLAGAIQAYAHAVADDLLARRQLDRSRVLFDSGSVAKKDLEAAQDAADKAAVDLRTTAMQVRMLGGDTEHPSARIELTAPIAGTIVQQGVAPAAGVKSPDNAPNLFTIADLSTVWVLCDVYENDLSRVQLAAAAHVRLNAYPDRVFEGHVDNISPLLDSATRAVKVRVELKNADGVMRLGMFGSAEIVSPTPRARLLVPASALLRLHDADWAFVQTGAGRFQRNRVVARPSTDGAWQQVVSGLARGDSVVKDALQFSQATARE